MKLMNENKFIVKENSSEGKYATKKELIKNKTLF